MSRSLVLRQGFFESPAILSIQKAHGPIGVHSYVRLLDYAGNQGYIDGVLLYHTIETIEYLLSRWAGGDCQDLVISLMREQIINRIDDEFVIAKTDKYFYGVEGEQKDGQG